MQKITTCLWFDGNAEEAVRFYKSIFKKSKIGKISRYTDVGPGPKGSVMTIEFNLEGRDFLALNGGPEFKFNEAISFVVNCRTQREIDYYWKKLAADGGRHVQCGWLTDRFGVSWQIVPSVLEKLIGDPQKGDKVMQAMLKMVKLDIAALRKAAR